VPPRESVGARPSQKEGKQKSERPTASKGETRKEANVINNSRNPADLKKKRIRRNKTGKRVFKG